MEFLSGVVISIRGNFSQVFFRALDIRENLMIIKDNFGKFCIKTYVVIPHLNCLIEAVQMRGYNIWFKLQIRKVIRQLSSNTPSYLEL